MTELNLRHHGENINPYYAANSDLSSWAGESTDLARPDGNVSGIVKRYTKMEQFCAPVTALGLIKAKYPDAIVYTGITNELRGQMFFIGVLVGAFGIGLGQLYLFDLLERGFERTFNKIFIVVACLFIFIGIYSFLRATRFEFFRPEDEPVIFDRKRRKVYRIFREEHPGFKGLFKCWPMRAAEYEWDLIDAEHNAILTTTGSTVTRYGNPPGN
jgi:hypothetical protein